MKQVAPNRFNVGLETDSNPKFASEGTYRFALNSALETTEGGIPTITNEVGNAVSAFLEEGYKVIGACLTNTSEIVIFATNEEMSQIGILNPEINTYTTTISSSCLNFSSKYPISCLFNIRKGCERMIYFTDRYNKYRSINLDNLLSYTSAPTIAQANSEDNWNCDEFSLTPNYQVPIIDLLNVEEGGGQLKVGTYQFAIQYIDEDGNNSDWFNVTTPVPVTVGNPNGDWRYIQGGLPVANTAEPEEGSVPTTSKSIRLSISNLDINYPYYRLAALHSTGAIARVTEVWYLEPVAIGYDTQEYVYRGPNTTIDIVGSLPDININNTPIHVAKAHAQIDQSLWLANLEGTKYNYADFQRAASKILATPITKAVQVVNALNPGDPKCPNTWWDSRSFMPDEVYAFGIQYLYADGSWSPVFHIPGRRPLSSDLGLVNTVESQFLGTGDFPRWRVENTGTESIFAYHETLSTTYPDIQDCSGESIWGEDYDGYTLAGEKIRHHRFPSRQTTPIYDDATDSISIYGVRFDNVDYPHNDIVGHRFLMAERTESNKTVLDNGFVAEIHFDGEVLDYKGVVPHSNDQTGKAFAFHSPKTLLEQRFLNADYYDFHTKAGSAATQDSVNDDIDIKGTAAPAAIYMYVSAFGSGDYNPDDCVPRRMATDSSIFVAPRSSQSQLGSFESALVNSSHFNTAYFVHYETEFQFFGFNLHIAAAKRNVDPYTSLSNIVYYAIQPGYQQTTDAVDIFGGDSFVTNMNYIDTAYINALDPSAKHLKTVVGDYLSGVWVDSELNFALRHGGTDRCNTVFNGVGPVWEHVRDKLVDPDPDTVNPITGQPAVDTKYVTREEFCTEYYAYNKDFSKTVFEKPGVSLSYQFDYCSDCLNSFPNRIRVSQKNYQESSLDNYRIFKDGDRNDLPGVSGNISSLLVYQDNLYALCARDIYMIPINAQTIQTSESLAYLGTGERLAIPPRRLSSTTYPYGGSQHLFSNMVTEFGAIYVDALSNKIIMLTPNGMQEISAHGMRKFFQRNMNFDLNTQFLQQLGISYPFLDNTTYEYGLGYYVTYDPEFKRIIITKKDYRLRDDKVLQLSSLGANGQINWVNDKFVVNKNSISVPIHFTDTNYFENKSWTLSYYVPSQHWASYHSYLPTMFFNDATRFYSVNGDNKIWRHGGTSNYQTYYGLKKDHILDFTSSSNPAIASTYTVFDVNSNFVDAETDTDDFFFDHAIIYNSYQSSGKLPVVRKTSSFMPATDQGLIAAKAERNWRISDFRDMVVDYTEPLFTDDWDDILNYHYIDKIPNDSVISSSKNPFEQGRFRDHYVGCRLFFNPRENVKVTTDLISSINKLSFR